MCRATPVPRPAPVVAATVITLVPNPIGTVAENAPLPSAVVVTTDEAPATSVSLTPMLTLRVRRGGAG